MTARPPLRALVVDDEPLAREGLELRLGWLPDVAVVAACATATDAIAAFEERHPDVAFIDVQMPELNGFGLLERISRDLLPAIVFVTAHQEYALRAFRVGAFDYLLKPFDDATLGATVERVRTFVTVIRANAAADIDDQAERGRDRLAGRIQIRREGRVVFVDPDDITWIEADGDTVRLHTPLEIHTLRSTMRGMEDRLDRSRFIRVHRGAIIAIHAIRELRPYSRGEHLVVLADGTTLPLSRRFRRRVTEVIETGA